MGCSSDSISNVQEFLVMYGIGINLKSLRVSNGNLDLEDQQVLWDLTCRPCVTPKLAGWSFTSVWGQVGVKPVVG